jgi:hypothetical protein
MPHALCGGAAAYISLFTCSNVIPDDHSYVEIVILPVIHAN